MGKGEGPKSKSAKEISEKKLNETFEHEHKKRKHNLSHEEGSQTDESLEKNFQLAQIDGNVFQLDSELSETKKLVEKLNILINEQKEQLDQEKHFRSIMQARLNDLEQYSRKNNIRIFGIPDNDRRESSSKSEELVLKLFKEKLGIPWMNHNSIEIAHRTGRFSEDSNRPIIVKLSHRKIKNEIILNRKKLKGKGITIAEDLTIENVRRLQKLNALEVCTQSWSFDGKIFCKNKDEVKIEVRSSDKIAEDIFLEAAQRRTVTVRQRDGAQASQKSQTQQAENERSEPVHEKEFSRQNEGAQTSEQNLNNNTTYNSSNTGQNIKDNVGKQKGKKKSENKDSKKNKGEDSHDSANAKSPSSKKTSETFSKNSDTSDDSHNMEIADVMSEMNAQITPQHSSTPRQDDKIMKIVAHQQAIDDRLKQIAGQHVD